MNTRARSHRKHAPLRPIFIVLAALTILIGPFASTLISPDHSLIGSIAFPIAPLVAAVALVLLLGSSDRGPPANG